MKIYSRDFSFENWFRRFFLLKMCPRIFSFYEDVFMKICSGKFSFEDLFKRFFLWKLVQEIFPSEDVFRKFFLLWRCVHEDLFRRFFFWRFIQEIFPLKIGLGDFSFEDLFKRFFLLKFWGHCVIDHVLEMLALEHWWSVVSFGHGAIWTMLVTYGILAMLVICDVVGWVLSWISGALKLWRILAMLVICDVCWMNFGLNFGGHQNCEEFVV